MMWVSSLRPSVLTTVAPNRNLLGAFLYTVPFSDTTFNRFVAGTEFQKWFFVVEEWLVQAVK